MREKLKYPFRKLRNFALSKQESKVEASSGVGEGLLTEVGTFMQDAEDMRAKFEGFLANGQIISGAAYDFSRSLQHMASYMMETFGDIADEEIGNIFNLLAKVQFEMSKLLDLFASHVSETIIKPTETMMTRIQQAAVIMKDQYDEKRKLYIVTQMEKQKGKSKRGKGNQTRQAFKAQANELNLYMQSLMQGQSESLVTQAVKYHSAQMHLFSKGLASISAVEPMMRRLASEKNIDRRLSEEDVSKDDFLNSREMDGAIDSETDSMASSSRHLLVEQIEPPRYSSESSEEFLPRRAAVISKSAPISPLMYHKREGTAKESSLESGLERVFMYALPSPLNGSGRWVENTKGTRKSQKHSDVHIRPACFSGAASKPNHITEIFSEAVSDVILKGKIKDQFVEMQHHQSYELKGIPSKNVNFFVEDAKEDHLSNLSPEKCRKYTQSGPLIDSARTSNNSQCANAREASSTANPREHISPLSYSKNVNFFVEDAKEDHLSNLSLEKRRRYTQSGPLIDSAWTSNNSKCANAREASSTANPREHISPLYKSGPINRSPVYSYGAGDLSPPPSSMPQISELHKLPLPPPGTLTPPKSPSHTPQHIAYSAPLGKIVQAVPSRAAGASPLPSPSPISRSLSIPASTHGADMKKDF